MLAQKIVATVHYCRLLSQELSKTREKAKILSSYNLKNSQEFTPPSWGAFSLYNLGSGLAVAIRPPGESIALGIVWISPLADTEAQSKKVQKRYDEEFKRQAVQLMIHSGKTQAQIGRELSCCAANIVKWIKHSATRNAYGFSRILLDLFQYPLAKRLAGNLAVRPALMFCLCSKLKGPHCRPLSPLG